MIQYVFIFLFVFMRLYETCSQPVNRDVEFTQPLIEIFALLSIIGTHVAVAAASVVDGDAVALHVGVCGRGRQQGHEQGGQSQARHLGSARLIDQTAIQ